MRTETDCSHPMKQQRECPHGRFSCSCGHQVLLCPECGNTKHSIFCVSRDACNCDKLETLITEND